MRILITGSRDFGDYRGFCDALWAVLAYNDVANLESIISGGLSATDSFSQRWAKSNDVDVLEFLPDWETFGKAATSIRDGKMLTEGRPDAIIAFPGGKGDRDLVTRAETMNIPVYRVEVKKDKFIDAKQIGR